MKKNKTEEIEFIIDENNRVDFRQVLQMINMYEEKIQKKQAIFDKVIEYIQNHQLVFKEHTTEEIDEWFNQFYIDIMQILKEAQNEKN